ncbi:MAG: glycosyltransferase [Planctomycetota bacterium]
MTPSVTVLTSTPFWRGGNGSTVRISALLRHLLGEGVRLRVVFAGSLRAADHERLHRAGLGRITLRETGSPPPTPPMDAPLHAFDDPAARRVLADDLARSTPTALIIEYLRHANALDGLGHDVRARVLTILDTHDVQHERAARFASVARPHQLAITRAEEAETLAAFDMLLAIQGRDAQSLARMAPGAEVLTVPHAIEPAQAAPAQPDRTPPQSSPPTVGFVGSASHANADGLAWFLRDCWADVRERVPGVTLEIAGDVDQLLACEGLTHKTLAAMGVRALGVVPDLVALREGWTAELCPLRIGGGLKIKTVEALGAGVPVISTPIGAEGFADTPADALRIASDGPAFASTLETLCDARAWSDASRSARHAARRSFSPDAAYGPLVARLRSHAVSHDRRSCLTGELTP